MYLRKTLLATLIAAAIAAPALAAPGAGVFAKGAGTITTTGSRTDVNVTGTTSRNIALINWSGYNVAPGESVIYATPLTGNRVVVNYDQSGNLSDVNGTVSAPSNLAVVLVNPNGVKIGSSANISARAFSAMRGTVEDGLLAGSIRVVIEPGDMDIAAGAAITAADASNYSAQRIGRTGDDIAITTAPGADRVMLPVSRGFNLDLTDTGAQQWRVPIHLLPAAGRTMIVADGSSLAMEGVTTPGTAQLIVQGRLDDVTLRNSTQGVQLTGGTSQDTQVTLDGYNGRLTATFGIGDLILRGNNANANINAQVFGDTIVDGNVIVGSTELHTRGFGGAQDGWSLTTSGTRELKIFGGPNPALGSNPRSTGTLGLLTTGELHTGTMIGDITIVPAAPDGMSSSAYTYTLGPAVSVGGSRFRIGAYINSTGLFESIGQPALMLDGFTSTSGTQRYDAPFDGARSSAGAGDITVRNSTLTSDATYGSITIGTMGNLAVEASQISADTVRTGGRASSVYTDSEVRGRIAELGYTLVGITPYHTDYLELVGTSVEKRESDLSNRIALYSSGRAVVDADSRLVASGRSGATYAAALGLARPSGSTEGLVRVLQGADLGLNPGDGSGVVVQADVEVVDPAGALGEISNWTAATPSASTSALYVSARETVLDGTLRLDATGAGISTPTEPEPTPPPSIIVNPIPVLPVTGVLAPTPSLITTVLPAAPSAPASWTIDSSTVPSSYVIDPAMIAAPVLPAVNLMPDRWLYSNSVTLPGISGLPTPALTVADLDPLQFLVSQPITTLPSVTTPTLTPSTPALPGISGLPTATLEPDDVDPTRWTLTQPVATLPAVTTPTLTPTTPTLPSVVIDPTAWHFNADVTLPPVVLPTVLPDVPPLPIVSQLSNPLAYSLRIEIAPELAGPVMRGNTLYLGGR